MLRRCNSNRQANLAQLQRCKPNNSRQALSCQRRKLLNGRTKTSLHMRLKTLNPPGQLPGHPRSSDNRRETIGNPILQRESP